jgi:hypothetical protein
MPTATSLGTALIALCVLLPACGGSAGSSAPGRGADASKTKSTIRAEVKAAEHPVLAQAVTAYNALIASKQAELEALEAQIEEHSWRTPDAAQGEGQIDSVAAEVERWKGSAGLLRTELKELRSRLEIYVQELATRG